MPHVVLDPGHGGTDPGAVGNGLREKDVVLDVALRAEKHLRRHGVKVTLTRRSDETLGPSTRVTRTNRAGADAVVSIHCNASENEAARGTETYHSIFARPGQGGHRLAMCVHPQVVRALRTLDRGIKTKKNPSTGRDYYYMIRETKPPAIIVELAFISNPEDARALSRREEAAIAIARGIVDYFGLPWQDVASASGPFKDVPSDHWAADEIRRVKEAGIMSGHSDGTFRPDQPPTRAELAVVVDRLLQRKG